MDRIDLQVDVPLLSYDEVTGAKRSSDDSYTTENISKRVQQAIAFKAERTKSTKPNGLLTALPIDSSGRTVDA